MPLPCAHVGSYGYRQEAVKRWHNPAKAGVVASTPALGETRGHAGVFFVRSPLKRNVDNRRTLQAVDRLRFRRGCASPWTPLIQRQHACPATLSAHRRAEPHCAPAPPRSSARRISTSRWKRRLRSLPATAARPPSWYALLLAAERAIDAQCGNGWKALLREHHAFIALPRQELYSGTARRATVTGPRLTRRQLWRKTLRRRSRRRHFRSAPFSLSPALPENDRRPLPEDLRHRRRLRPRACSSSSPSTPTMPTSWKASLTFFYVVQAREASEAISWLLRQPASMAGPRQPQSRRSFAPATPGYPALLARPCGTADDVRSSTASVSATSTTCSRSGDGRRGYSRPASARALPIADAICTASSSSGQGARRCSRRPPLRRLLKPGEKNVLAEGAAPPLYCTANCRSIHDRRSPVATFASFSSGLLQESSCGDFR